MSNTFDPVTYKGDFVWMNTAPQEITTEDMALIQSVLKPCNMVVPYASPPLSGIIRAVSDSIPSRADTTTAANLLELAGFKTAPFTNRGLRIWKP